MTKRQRLNRSDGDLTAKRILEAAGRLFAAAGFAETTNKAIAEHAGVDVASINYHFGGRAGLYGAALVEAHRQVISMGALEAIDESGLAAKDKLARIIDTLVDFALAPDGWAMRLLAREVLAPSSHFTLVLESEILPKMVVMQRILSEASGISADDPRLLRCMLSIVAPCLVLAVTGNGVPGPPQLLRQMPKEALSAHFRAFVMAGLAAVGR